MIKIFFILYTISQFAIYSDEIKNCKIKYYDVYGTSNSQILKSIKDNSKLVNKNGFFGYTNFTWKSKCQEINIDCTVTLPRWNDASKSSAEVVETWENFYNALVLHEQGHIDIMSKHFDKAKEEVANLSCKEALDIFNKANTNISYENKKYDKETEHGKTQGAYFSGSNNNFQAIAFSSKSGAFGFSFNQKNQEQAEELAISYCKQKDCKIVIWSKDACSSLAVGKNNAYGTSWNTNQTESEKKALDNCKKFGKNCKIRTSACPKEN